MVYYLNSAKCYLEKKELNAREEIMKKMKNEELIKEKQIKENTKKLSLLELKPIKALVMIMIIKIN